MRSRSILRLTSLLVAVILAMAVAIPVLATTQEPPAGSRSLTVLHGPVEVALADPESDGHQLGDLRVVGVDTTTINGRPSGRLEATLTTTSIDAPNIGDEQRIGVLVFSFGEAGQHQVTVHGTANYPADGPTIASGVVTVRPVLGGSGRFFGVTGDAVTTHHDDGTWSHELRLVRGGQRATASQREQTRPRDRSKVEASAERATRKADRAEARATRKADRATERQARTAERAEPAVDAAVTAAVDETGVVRTDLGLAEPATAMGQELGLWHYVIPAGEELAPHTHPGTQLAYISDGELEYSVISGEGVIVRSDGTQELAGPGTYVLATGDAIIENPELVHYGANRTEEPVTILASTLYPAGEPLSTVVEAPEG